MIHLRNHCGTKCCYNAHFEIKRSNPSFSFFENAKKFWLCRTTLLKRRKNGLRVVPHFSLGIVEQAKRERAWKSPHARKGDTRQLSIAPHRVSPFLRGMIFTTWKCLISRFTEDVNKQRQNFISLSELWIWSLEIRLQEVSPTVASLCGQGCH